MIVGVDHIVILVRDLAAASDHYTQLGFTVVPGGTHADGATHNALIVFADGTYLELLAFLRAAPEHRWWPHVAHGEGFIDWALLPDAIASDIATARKHGVVMEGPIPGGRVRPDGQEIAWEMGIPGTPDLPFLCGDVTPRNLRVPDGAARKHPNGVIGIASVTIAVTNITESIERYRGLIDVEAHRGRRSSNVATSPTGIVIPESGAHIALFPSGETTIVLAQPTSDSSPTEEQAVRPLHEHIQTRGDSPYALTLRVKSGYTTGLLNPALAHGMRIELVSE